MRVNLSKSRSLLVSRSRTGIPLTGDLFYMDSALARSDALTLLKVLFDAKLPFEYNMVSVFSSASRTLGIHLVL